MCDSLKTEAQQNPFKSSQRKENDDNLGRKLDVYHEMMSNALGPTLDVSIIDNLKLMRDLFKCKLYANATIAGADT